MAEQQPLEDALGILGLPQREGHLTLGKLEARTAGGGRCGGLRQHLLSGCGIARGKQHASLQFRRLGNEDAVGIAGRKAAQQGFGSGFVPRFVVGFGAQKVGVVGQLLAGLSSLAQIGFSLRVPLVKKIGVAQRQIGRRRRFPAVPTRILAHAFVCSGRAQRGQLLGHGAQFRRSHKGLPDASGSRAPRRPGCPAHRFRGLAGCPAGGLRCLRARGGRLIGLLRGLPGGLLRRGGRAGRRGCRAARRLRRDRLNSHQPAQQACHATKNQPRSGS